MQLQREEKSVVDSSCLLACCCVHGSDSRVLVLCVDCAAVKLSVTEGLLRLEIREDPECSMEEPEE